VRDRYHLGAMFGGNSGARLGVALLAAGLMVACGETPKLPEAPGTTPLKTDNVTVSQAGPAAVTIDQSSVTYKLDSSGTLAIGLTLISSAPTTQTIAVRASLYDPQGNLIGDATGGQVNVAAGATTTIQLNGQEPHGEIASALFETTVFPIPTTPPSESPSPSASASTSTT